jgi:hypothetical protein
METIVMSRSLKLVAVAVFAVLLGACATGSGTKSDKQSASQVAGKVVPVEDRAVQRWQLLIAGKAAEAYDYLSPGVRSAKPREQYAQEMSQRPVHWKTVAFSKKQCEGDSCTVTVHIEYEVKMPGIGIGMVSAPSEVEERWIQLDGTWYHVPEQYLQGGLR